MNPDEIWYKNAILYAVDVHRFMDADGDGCGDFAGLTSRLDYLADLGVTCLWLLPFYPTPGRDNGYDIKNYYDVAERLGTLDDFIHFLHEAGERSIRVILDLVMDHTSDQHPWFIAARYNKDSRFRQYYYWADHPPPVPPDMGTMFPGEQESVWTYDAVAGAYYHHRFYRFEPSLNTGNPEVREEIERALDFWLSFGISGFRIDAASHMIESPGLSAADPRGSHGILKEIRAFVAAREPDAALIGEADVAAEQLAAFFGESDELNLLFNFVLNNYLFLSLATEESVHIHRALTQLPVAPGVGQWANFLRNLDELDLERLSEEDRRRVCEAFAPEERMRIYGRGIRRRLAPMLDGDPRRLKMAFSLLLSVPGTPVFVYGDEIGMGEDLAQEGRNAVRAPMQWSGGRNAGFSTAAKGRLFQPVISEGPFGYRQVNVAAQQEDPDSLLNAVKQLVWVRRACPEFGYGTWRLVEVDEPSVFAHRCVWKNGIVFAVHNLSGKKCTVTLDLRDQRGRELVDLLAGVSHVAFEGGTFEITLPPYGYKWYRIRGEHTQR